MNLKTFENPSISAKVIGKSIEVLFDSHCRLMIPCVMPRKEQNELDTSDMVRSDYIRWADWQFSN